MTEMVQKTIDYMRQKQAGESTGHDWWHTKRVYDMALRLGKAQSETVDMEIVALGALLHDIEDWKFNNGDEDAGPAAAAKWLESLGADETTVTHVKFIIRDLSFKGSDTGSMKSREGMIVQDADRLDAVGAIGIARTFAFGGKLGSEVFNPEMPARVNITGDEYKDKNIKMTTVNHFYEKLFKLKNLYNLEEARTIGLVRHAYLKDFMRTLLEECGATDTQQYRLLDDL
jgi:Predicted HD superfamily hydrolase